jgi:hypothetical protein
MSEAIELLTRGALIGTGGAAVMDAWALVARRAFNVHGLDYALLGRWIGHFPQGRFFHRRIVSAHPIRGERPIGWAAHYSIGIAFALVLLAIFGLEWARSPTLLPALIIGLGTIVAPWLVMQPAMGAGVAASRTPDPRATRIRNVATHTAYGPGLFATAVAVSLVWPPG